MSFFQMVFQFYLLFLSPVSSNGKSRATNDFPPVVTVFCFIKHRPNYLFSNTSNLFLLFFSMSPWDALNFSSPLVAIV